MDTAHLLVTEAPGREVNMIVGAGTLFGKRDRPFPEAHRDRWRVRATSNVVTADMARRFDGTTDWLFRSGATRDGPGAWVVNCTGERFDVRCGPLETADVTAVARR